MDIQQGYMMPGVFIKDDLRKIKTQKSLLNAFMLLLEKKSFKNITVNDLCGEAFISRSAFYAHYKDKYDLLGALLESCIADEGSLDLDKFLDTIVYSNSKVIKCILKDADSETHDIVNNFVLNYLNCLLKKTNCNENSPEYLVFTNFCMGGLMQQILLHTKAKSPQDLNESKQYFVGLMNYLLNWIKPKTY